MYHLDDPDRARAFLMQFADGESLFRAALTEEVTGGWASSNFGISERDLVAAAAAGIAGGTIAIVTLVGPGAPVTFDAARPRAPSPYFIGFPDIKVAATFVDEVQHDPRSAAHLRDALRHEAALRGVLAVAPGTALASRLKAHRTRRLERLETEVDLTRHQIAHLLMARWLRLMPLGLRGTLLQLAWRHTGSGSDSPDGAAADDAPAPRRPIRPPVVEAPRNPVPVAPEKLPRQGECLMAAAKAGFPLVDEPKPPATSLTHAHA